MPISRTLHFGICVFAVLLKMSLPGQSKLTITSQKWSMLQRESRGNQVHFFPKMLLKTFAKLSLKALKLSI